MNTMQYTRSFGSGFLAAVLAGVVAFHPPVVSAATAVNTTVTSSTYASFPIIATETATPFAIININNDHQLYFKAYNDYSDIDKDGDLDTTYLPSFKYYGYFDSTKCYDYSTTNKRFEPAGFTDANYYCTGSMAGKWSGNFLNWVSMARIDVIRKILIGGYRYVDTATETVLERTYLPNDAHSWAKYYNGADINLLTPFTPSSGGLTICNTTLEPTFTKTSVNVTDPPLMRVANGNYLLWASNERWQCLWSSEKTASNSNDPAKSGINAASSNPDKSTVGLGEKDYVVRVKVCIDGMVGDEKCKRYPSGNLKPIGLLQDYGDDNLMHFGMMAGSYSKNKSGGDLIKEVGTFNDEIAVTTDGTFTKTVPKVGTNASEGIVNALHLWRIIKYKHSDGTYGTSGVNNNNCTWGLNSFSNGQCQNWGNPFAEIYFNTLRYLNGESVTGAFRGNDSNEIPGLNTPQAWSPDPLNQTNRCARLNTVNFNSSVISYDADDLDGNPGVSELGWTLSSAQITDLVGAGEGIHGRKYFVGKNGTTNDGLCTAKVVNSLGQVLGTCPEAPRLDGSYRVAGLAYYAHIQDLRPDLEGKQTVDTYSVSLSTGAPEITVPIPGTSRTVKILPACQNVSVGGNCALVDFKVVSQDVAAGTGKFYINWEDSEQGGDFDQDMWGVLEYQATSTTIKVTTNVIAESTGYQFGFGFVISGTTQDGYHAYSGSNGYNYSDPSGVTGCSNCRAESDPTSGQKGPRSYTFTLGSADVSLLDDPLYYASKWGAFEDENSNQKPDKQSEWDRRLTDGTEGTDGIPDTYFFVTDPRELEEALRRVFNDILAKTASGTAAAVVANSREGAGAIYQALYEPLRRDKDNTEVTWIGTLHGLLLDEHGYIREDGDGDGVLDDYNTDPAVQIYFDEDENETKFRRLASTDPNVLTPVDPDTGEFLGSFESFPLTDLRELWNARERLSDPAMDTVTQRSYGAPANTGRYILTAIEDDGDGLVDASEVKNFTPSGLTGFNAYLNAATDADAAKIIRFIRGEEGVASTFRNRTMDYDDDGDMDVLRLGDIIDSTPTPVGAPAEAFDLLYEDLSYAEFRRQYRDRRTVVYVGGNDGMLHAFNGGFYDAAAGAFRTNNAAGTATQHPLGAELWAYVPMNALPHLKWLTELDYPHNYYVDAKPRVFDARIFNDDATHPNGWGTVLVVGMRLGGGPIQVDSNNNGTLGGSDRTLRSAYAILDVTDPEQPPRVLAEITDANLNYTTSFPTVFAMRDRNDNDPDDWYLVFGSGPTSHSSATSTAQAYLYVYDLKVLAGTKAGTAQVKKYALTGATNSFVGDPVSTDWDLDFFANAVYVGTLGGTASAPTGKLYRLGTEDQPSSAAWVAPTVLYDAARPILATPSVTIDQFRVPWVFFGTGRFFVDADKSSTALQALYGLKDGTAAQSEDGAANATITASQLVDVTTTEVKSDGSLVNSPVAGVTTVAQLDQYITNDANGKKGWVMQFDSSSSLAAQGLEPALRNVNQTALLDEILLASAFRPTPDLCSNEGRSVLFGVYYRTGTARGPKPIFGVNEQDIAYRSIELGRGVGASPSLQMGSGTDKNVINVFTQTSTGAIERDEAETGGKNTSGEISWREPTN